MDTDHPGLGPPDYTNSATWFCLSSFMTSSSARTDLSRPTNSGANRITWAFSRGENPETADLDLVDQLDEKVKAAEVKMDEFRRKLMLRWR